MSSEKPSFLPLAFKTIIVPSKKWLSWLLGILFGLVILLATLGLLFG